MLRFCPRRLLYFLFVSHRLRQLARNHDFRHDDPIPIRSDQVRFVNEDVAFVFYGLDVCVDERYWKIVDYMGRM